jgi:p21-activated kinase 1
VLVVSLFTYIAIEIFTNYTKKDLWTIQGNSTTSSVNSAHAKSQNNGNGKAKISSPYNMVHVTHVGFNPQTGEFTGMPREWHILLQQSGITKKEQQQNPQVFYFFFCVIKA